MASTCEAGWSSPRGPTPAAVGEFRSPTGTERSARSPMTTSSKRFNSPNDVAVDRDGHVYISDPRYVGNERASSTSEVVYLIGPRGRHPALHDGHRI